MNQLVLDPSDTVELAAWMFPKLTTPPPLAPAQTGDPMQVYCYVKQHQSAIYLLMEMGFGPVPPIRRVSHHEELLGMARGVWVEISNHPEQAPAKMVRTVHMNGFLLLSLSDQFRRDGARRSW